MSKLRINLETNVAEEIPLTQVEKDQQKVDKDNEKAKKDVKDVEKAAKKIKKNVFLATLSPKELEGFTAIIEDGDIG